MMLQVFEAVFKGEAVVEVVRVGAAVALGSWSEGRALKLPVTAIGRSQGSDVGQVAEAFAEIDQRRQRGEIVGAQRLNPAGMAEACVASPTIARRLVRRVGEELVVELRASSR